MTELPERGERQEAEGRSEGGGAGRVVYEVEPGDHGVAGGPACCVAFAGADAEPESGAAAAGVCAPGQDAGGQVLGRRRQALADLVGDGETLLQVRDLLDPFVKNRLLVLGGEERSHGVPVGFGGCRTGLDSG